MVLGVYIYADGPLHVQATLAADVLGTGLAKRGQDVAMAYAGTPVTASSYLRTSWKTAMNGAGHGVGGRRNSRCGRRVSASSMRPPRRTDLERRWGKHGCHRCDRHQQGPNYSLAKRLQRWRAIESRRKGQEASFNVAPPTWTVSVTKNRVLAMHTTVREPLVWRYSRLRR